MSFLNHLWDETVAGPLPDSGQLRRFSSSNSAAASPNSILSMAGGCELSSPASCHDSPLTPTLGKDWRRAHRKKVAEPRNPTVFDWVMIGSLDR